jgi:membrane protease YdiL (CAAX protease family)
MTEHAERKELDTGSLHARKLPAFFQFNFVFLPFIFFLFEFGKPGSLFTDYQIYAALFLAVAYVAALVGSHRGLARINLVATAFLVAPPLLMKLYVALVGSKHLNADFVYYLSQYAALAAILYYLLASGLSVDKLYFTLKTTLSDRWLTFLFILSSAVTLASYFYFTGSESPTTEQQSTVHLSVATAAVFALANGAVEELWFRSFLLGTLARSFPAGFAVIYQALLFGLIHYDGIPSGGAGIALAFVFGAALGWLTVRSKSILPALCVHIAADFTICLYM